MATFAVYSINRLVFMTMVEGVYCQVHTESLYKTDNVIFFIHIPCIIDYIEINQLNALNYILPYFLLRWLLHVSAKQCHPQGATIFLSEPLQHQYGRRQVIGHMTGPTYRRAV
jgi:hypothetical protein